MKKNKISIYVISIITAFSFLSVQNALPVSARSKNNSLVSQQTRLKNKLSNIKNGLNQKQAYCKKLQKDIKSLQSQIDLESKKLDEISANINQKEAALAVAQSEVEAQEETIEEHISAMYKTDAPTDGPFLALTFILDAKDVPDLFDKFYFLQQVAKNDEESLNLLNDNLKTVETEKAAIIENKEAAANFKSSLDDKKAMLERAEKANTASISSLREAENITQSKLNKIMLERKRAEEQISQFHLNYSSSVNDSIYSKGHYSWPVPGHNRISSPYGGRRNHKGIDIPAPTGTVITAADDGIVIKVNSSDRWGHGWGYHVMISHGNGFATQYAHCSKILVFPGQHVKKGQPIALCGNTGHSFGSHLHFEAWRNGQRYNPSIEL